MLKNEAKERSREMKFEKSTVFDQEGRPATNELTILPKVFFGHSFLYQAVQGIDKIKNSILWQYKDR